MKKKLALWIAMFVIFLTAGLDAKDRSWGPFDRLLVTESFLDVIYPDLKHIEGVLFLRGEEFHVATGAGNWVDLISCKAGSGIIFPNSPIQVPPPHCTGTFLPNSSEFLSMSITYGLKYPIYNFGAYGSFVESQSKSVAAEIVEHPDWTEEQDIEAVRKSEARFGPDRKTEFLARLPVQAIFEFTGCRLVPKSAEFHAARLEGEAGHSYALAEWRVTGNRLSPGGKRNDTCVARFEPFDGKLLALDRF
jgi:hypothetical protein